MIGEKIRALRKNKALSISELAARVGVTDSYISQLERNIVDPSVSVLRRISIVLDTPIASFFDEIYEEPALIRPKDRQEIPSPMEGLSFELLSPVPALWGNHMEILEFTLKPRATGDPLVHTGETCIHIFKGSLDVILEKTSYSLKKGDSITINSNIPYCLCNTSQTKTVGILCSTGSLRKEATV